MLGQTKALNILNSFSLTNIPHSLLFIGEVGSGKHTLASSLSSRLGMDLIDMTEHIEDSYILDMYNSLIPSFYLIDLSQVSDKEQNKLLKLVEEPPLNCFLILIGESTSLVIPTILNRCFKIELEEYSRKDLKSFSPKDWPEGMLKTPGQVINFNFNTLEATEKLVNIINCHMKGMVFPKALDIADKINYSDEYDKVDLNAFLNLLLEENKNKYLREKKPIHYKNYIITLGFKRDLVNKKLNLHTAVENLLTKLWRASNEC